LICSLEEGRRRRREEKEGRREGRWWERQPKAKPANFLFFFQASSEKLKKN
jgi:hypothetical protein